MIHGFESSSLGDLPDALVMATVYTDNLKGRGDCSFVLPHDVSPETPLVILPHGVHGSHWSWPLLGQAGRTLKRLVAHGDVRPMVLAMPSDGLAGYGSVYHKGRRRNVREWITSDIPEVASRLAPMLGDTWFIGGLSMGGRGAIRLAVTSGERFSAATAHSTVTRIEDMNRFGVGTGTFEPDYVDDDIADLATVLANHNGELPPIRLDCGTSDSLLGVNRELHRVLTALGIPHEYKEYSGGHNWTYWQDRLEDDLRFFQSIVDDMSLPDSSSA